MLKDYHDSLVKLIADHFGDSLDTVQAYFSETQSNDPESGLVINTPAALVEVERFGEDVDEDQADGTDPIRCHVAIHCVLGSQTENLQHEIRNFAAEVIRLIRKKRPGGCDRSEKPEELEAMPGRFKAGTAGYDSFVVVFSQVIHLGEVAWKPEVIPQQIYFGRAPLIGAGHEDDYTLVSGE